ncbi:MAG: glycosyltransferase family 39 protein [bacterium]
MRLPRTSRGEKPVRKEPGATGRRSGRLGEALWILFLVSFCLLALVPGMDRRDLWLPDEVRYTEVAREMTDQGACLLPSLNGSIYSEKPPLFFWLLAALAGATGALSPITGRWISVAALIGTVISVHLLGTLLFDRRSGRVAALLLATMAHPFWFSHLGVMDNLLMFFVAASILAFYAGSEGRLPGWAGCSLSGLAMGLGVLSKGPLGLLLPWLAIACHLFWGEGVRGWKRGALWWTLLAALVPVLAWLVPACIQGGPEYTQVILWKQNVGRAVTGWAHKKPLTFYLEVLPGGLAPWVVMLPGALWAWLAKRAAGATGEAQRWRLPLAWFGVVFVFLSLISAKRDKYLLPVYPAASLIIGRALVLAESMRWTERRKGIAVEAAVWLLLIGLALGGLGAGMFALWAPPQGAAALFDRVAGGDLEAARLLAPGSRMAVAGLSLLAVLCAFLGLRFARRGGLVKSLASGIPLFFGISLYLSFHVMPAMNGSMTAEVFCRTMRAGAPDLDKARLGLFQKDYSAAFNYCLRRSLIPVLRRPEDVAGFFAADEKSYLISPEENLRKLEETLAGRGLRMSRVAQGRVFGRRTCLITAARDGTGPKEEAEDR